MKKNRILIIEESAFFSSTLALYLKTHLGLEAIQCNTFKKAEELLEKHKDQLLAIVTSIVLSDAHDGEVVDLATASKIPTIVLTASYSEEVRERFLEKDIVDFFIKAEVSLELVARTIKRLQMNKAVTIVVADDSPVTRTMAVRFLKRHFFNVLSAKDGAEAYGLIEKNPDVFLLITDRQMPRMDGFELTKKVRKIRSREELAIIGLSAFDSDIKPAKFLKTGADDFLSKPFGKEELYCRVYQNVERLEKQAELSEIARVDRLTGFMSRSTFLKEVPGILKGARKRKQQQHITFVGIDFLQKINADFGYSAGDDIIRQFSQILKGKFGASDLAARFGGGEFCILNTGISVKEIEKRVKELKTVFENENLGDSDHQINITATIAVVSAKKSSLDQMLICAHNCMIVVRSSGVGQLEMMEIS